jgi:hypothetical protein
MTAKRNLDGPRSGEYGAVAYGKFVEATRLLVRWDRVLGGDFINVGCRRRDYVSSHRYVLESVIRRL